MNDASKLVLHFTFFRQICVKLARFTDALLWQQGLNNALTACCFSCSICHMVPVWILLATFSKFTCIHIQYRFIQTVYWFSLHAYPWELFQPGSFPVNFEPDCAKSVFHCPSCWSMFWNRILGLFITFSLDNKHTGINRNMSGGSWSEGQSRWRLGFTFLTHGAASFSLPRVFWRLGLQTHSTSALLVLPSKA